MELLNPTITIHNTDSASLLVRYQHDFGDGTQIDITVKVPRQDMTSTHPAIPFRDLTAYVLRQGMAQLDLIAKQERLQRTPADPTDAPLN